MTERIIARNHVQMIALLFKQYSIDTPPNHFFPTIKGKPRPFLTRLVRAASGWWSTLHRSIG
jgi:hypothetical protein